MLPLSIMGVFYKQPTFDSHEITDCGALCMLLLCKEQCIWQPIHLYFAALWASQLLFFFSFYLIARQPHATIQPNEPRESFLLNEYFVDSPKLYKQHDSENKTDKSVCNELTLWVLLASKQLFGPSSAIISFFASFSHTWSLWGHSICCISNCVCFWPHCLFVKFL